jgi:hypothetical protein
LAGLANSRARANKKVMPYVMMFGAMMLLTLLVTCAALV